MIRRLRVRNPKAVEKLLTVQQISELLQVSPRAVYEWAHMGFIPHYKFPKGIRFKVSEVEQWIKRRKVSGGVSYKVII